MTRPQPPPHQPHTSKGYPPASYAASLIAVASASLCRSRALRFATIRCRDWKANQRAISISGFAFSSPFFSMAAVTRERVAICAKRSMTTSAIRWRRYCRFTTFFLFR